MASEYKVLSIDELSRVGDLGGIERYSRVRIKTKGGVKITVDIEKTDLTPEKAAPILLAEAQNADKILKL